MDDITNVIPVNNPKISTKTAVEREDARTLHYDIQLPRANRALYKVTR